MIEPANPKLAAMKSTAAVLQPSDPRVANRPVARIPKPAKKARKRLRPPAASATAPSTGAVIAINSRAPAVTYPHRAVAWVSPRPAAIASSRKNGGKSAAITVVAKAELAQS